MRGSRSLRVGAFATLALALALTTARAQTCEKHTVVATELVEQSGGLSIQRVAATFCVPIKQAPVTTLAKVPSAVAEASHIAHDLVAVFSAVADSARRMRESMQANMRLDAEATRFKPDKWCPVTRKPARDCWLTGERHFALVDSGAALAHR